LGFNGDSRVKVALTIAGSDPSGGAGLQADLKTFHQHRVYGMSVLTLLTVQNTQRVEAIQMLAPEFVLSQLNAVLCDIPPDAAKTGAMGSAAVIEAVAERAERFSFPLVVDPVMISKHGDSLIDDAAIDVLQRKLVPLAFLITPNRQEAARLTQLEVADLPSMEKAARLIASMGAKNVLIKGGQDGADAVDLLWSDGRADLLRAPRITTFNTHGTGCVLSAAITARLANGDDLGTAVRAAKRFISVAIRTNPGLGNGKGPVNLHADST
jgi:hydroxymethylpyrimidine/phosphomethylpyrimidine kinase